MNACPDCEATVPLTARPVQGEILPCPDCGTELEVLSLSPLALGRAPEVEEDWGE